MTCLYQEQLDNNLSAIQGTRERLLKILKSYGFSDTQCHNYLLILSEYISNLIRHSKCLDNKIAISVYRDSDHLTIEIEDNSDYYEPFARRLKQTTPDLKADVSGMGISLITSLVLKAHYQAIETGCLFRFATDTISSLKETIVVVDDDPVLLTLIEDYLAADYAVEGFLSVVKAMQFISDSPPSLIISDIEMPDCDGLSFRKQLSEDVALAQIPFIFLTGVDDLAIEQDAITQGIDDYLNKPVSKAKLLSGVQRILYRYQQMLNTQKSQDMQQFEMMHKRLPETSQGYDIAFAQQAADSKSGDFVICQEFEQDSYFFLGDVMGHGREAAFHGYTYAGYLRAFLRSAKFKSATEFMHIFSGAIAQDQLLQEQLLSLLVIRLSKNTVEIIAAGHEAPVLIGPDGITIIPVSGPLPGFLPDTQYTSHQTNLAYGQRLLAYTDGLTDALQSTSTDSTLQSILAKLDLSQNSTMLLDQLLSKLPERDQRQVNDDISCLLISQ